MLSLSRFVLAFCFAPLLATAGENVKSYAFDGDFEDAVFGIENAIINQGLTIDYVSHVGEMLERTRSDVGSDVVLFTNAQVFLFCSAVVSRKVMEADPMNIGHCPYGVFAAETDDGIQIGYRRYPAGVMQEVEALLDTIAQEAAEGF
ncbi:MAG: DUF302 domain-containing protein [Paracoccaceae bacterium]|nr:DUF302 domain-containing protein [Paracoccaceae bacterium]